MMFAINDNIIDLPDLRKTPIMDFFYFVSFKKDKLKLLKK